MNNWKKISISADVSVFEAMKIINSAGTQFVIVVDSADTLLGVLTDGDIRRGILKDIPLTAPVSEMMNRNPLTLSSDVTSQYSLDFLKLNHILHVPLLDKKRRVQKIVSINEKDESLPHQQTVVLMVGGLGSRLGELTANCPKPMLLIGGKPVLEVIIDNLKEHGFSDFILCVNYKANMIQDHFGDGSAFGIKIRYVHEHKRMGTAGALTILPDDISKSFLVMNGDIVTKVNFTRLLSFHKESKAMATMAVRKYDLQVPFGVVKTDDSCIIGIEEKPIHTFLVSAGIYMVEKDCTKYLPKDAFFDMPQLFDTIIKNKEITQAFPIHEYWLDIGREDDLLRAQKDFHGDDK